MVWLLNNSNKKHSLDPSNRNLKTSCPLSEHWMKMTPSRFVCFFTHFKVASCLECQRKMNLWSENKDLLRDSLHIDTSAIGFSAYITLRMFWLFELIRVQIRSLGYQGIDYRLLLVKIATKTHLNRCFAFASVPRTWFFCF